jgi:four helix bundle protein
MGTGFHDLEVWREARALAVQVYVATKDVKDFSLRDQIRRAAVSIPSNIAEGDERDTDKDSVRFFFIAKGSLAEPRTQIEIAVEVGLIPAASAEPLLVSAASLGRRLGALIKARLPHVQPLAHRPSPIAP